LRGRPADKLDAFQNYRLPKPMETRYGPPVAYPYSSTSYQVDPEDPDYQPEFVEEPVKRRRDLLPPGA
jgi:hypothetical protein